MSGIKSTSNRLKVGKNLLDITTVSKPLARFDSSAFSAINANIMTQITENAYFFNGGYLSFTLPGLPSGNLPRTLEAMVMFDTLPASANAGIISYGGTTSGSEFVMVPRGNEISNNIGVHYNGLNTNSGKAVTDFGFGTWFHVCATYDGTSQKVYINGTLYVTTANTITTGPSDVNIGRRANGLFLVVGYIKEARIWNKVLTQAQVNDVVNTRLLYNPPGLIFYSRLNDVSPTSTKELIAGIPIISNSTVTAVPKTFNIFARGSSFVL